MKEWNQEAGTRDLEEIPTTGWGDSQEAQVERAAHGEQTQKWLVEAKF